MNPNQAEKKTRTPGSRKTLKIGSLTVTTTAVVVAIFVLFNLFVSELPTTFTKLDRSASSLFTVSDESAAVIGKIEGDVHFYILTQRGNENPNITRLLDRYHDLNSHITYSTVDPAANPQFTEQYTDKTLSDNSVIAVSEKRSFAVDASEFDGYVYTATGDVLTAEEYQYYYQMYAYYGQALEGFEQCFMGDAKLAAAADYVTRGSIPVLCMLTGHGEEELNASYAQYLDAQNMQKRELSLLNLDAVPEDCAVLYIGNPSADIQADELELLRAYVRQGGKIFLVTGAENFSSGKMPNLTALAADFGMEPVDGLIVETDQNHYLMYPYTLVPEYGSAETEPFDQLSRRSYVILSEAHGILDSGSGSVTPILYTSSKAYAKDLEVARTSIAQEDGDVSGMFYLGAVGETAEGGTLVWFSSTDISNPQMDMYGGNSTTFLAFLNWMTDSSHTMLSLPGREYKETPLQVTEADHKLWSVVLIGVIPVLTLAGGFVIWLRRRKK